MVALHRRQGHRVLIVEDTDYLRDAIVLTLTMEGYDARGVENGREALHVLRHGFETCLIVLDLMMPEMDGWQFRAEQRRDASIADIPVAVLTAALHPDREAKKLGAVAGLHKPLDVNMVVSLAMKHCRFQFP